MWLTDHDWCFYVANYCIVSDFWQWMQKIFFIFCACLGWLRNGSSHVENALLCLDVFILLMTFVWHFGVATEHIQSYQYIQDFCMSLRWFDFFGSKQFNFICIHLSLGKTKANQPRLITFLWAFTANCSYHFIIKSMVFEIKILQGGLISHIVRVNKKVYWGKNDFSSFSWRHWNSISGCCDNF